MKTKTVAPTKALAAPKGEETSQEAARRLGISISELKGHAAVLPRKENGRPQVWNAVALHKAPFDLVKAFEFMDEFCLLVQAVPRNPGPFATAMRKAKSLSTNGGYHGFLDEVSRWALPQGRLGFCRQLVMWGSAGQMIPAGSELTGAMDGFMPSYQQIGTLIAAVLHRQAFHQSAALSSVKTDMHPLDFAVPHSPLKKYRNFLALNNIAYGYWVGVVDVKTLPELLALDVDLYLHLENVAGKLYITAIVRASSMMDGSRASSLDKIDEQLRHIGRWERLTGANMVDAFLAMVPGAKPAPAWKRHHLPESHDFANELTSRLSNPGDGRGNVVIGLTDDQQPFFIDPAVRGTLIIHGQQQTGKTTLASTIALMQTPAVVILQQTAVEGEAAPNWVLAMGGQVKELDLPDAENAAAEQKLFKSDDDSARAFVGELYHSWVKEGKASGLPLLVRPKTRTVRNSMWMYSFYKYFRFAWAQWTETIVKTHQICVVIFDDLIGLPELAEDAYLGKLKIQVGKQIRQEMRSAINTAAKQNLRITFTLHSLDELQEFPAGFFESTTLVIGLFLDEHATAEVYDPRARRLSSTADGNNSGFKAQKINVRLPKPITDIVGRSERVI